MLEALFILSLQQNELRAQISNILNIETDGLYLQPSETGVHNNKWVVGSYVNSKSIIKDLPIRSYIVSGDYQLKRGLQSLYVGGGFGTQQLVASPYAENEFYSTVAYHRIFKNNSIHIGLQPGIIIRNLDNNKLVFPDQYDRGTGTYNPSMPTGEIVELGAREIKMNMNFGISYGRRFNKFYSKLIFTGRNINTPNLSFTDNSLKLYRQWIVEAKCDYYLTNTDVLKTFLMVRNSSEVSESFLGGQLAHKLVKNNLAINEISGGSYIVMRNSKYPNNIVFNMAIGLPSFKVGFAYAYNFVNQNSSTTSFNSFEIVLLFKGLNKALEYYSVPCEIY